MNNTFLYYLLLSTSTLLVAVSAKYINGAEGKYLSVFKEKRMCDCRYRRGEG